MTRVVKKAVCSKYNLNLHGSLTAVMVQEQQNQQLHASHKLSYSGSFLLVIIILAAAEVSVAVLWPEL